MIRLIFHAPFKYYIGKEHFLVSLDEIYNQSMSKMINRMKNSKGDPAHYLAEKERRRFLVSLEMASDQNQQMEENSVSIFKSSVMGNKRSFLSDLKLSKKKSVNEPR